MTPILDERLTRMTESYIEDLFKNPKLINQSDNERHIVRTYATPEQKECYARILMERLLQ